MDNKLKPKPKFKPKDTVCNLHEYGIVLDREYTKNKPNSLMRFTEGWWYKVLVDDKYWVWMHEDDMILIDEAF